MICYRVRGWEGFYEKNHRTERERVFRWIAVPTRHDGKGFRRLARHPRKVDVFCAWNLILQVAGKMPSRGVLADEEGPLDADDLADQTGYPADIFTAAFNVLTDNSLKISWLESFEWIGVRTSSDKSGYRTGQDTTEQNRTEHTPQPPKGGKYRDGRPHAETRSAPQGAEAEQTPEGFARWWSTYPKCQRKVGKAKCLRHWVRNGLEDIADRVVSALVRSKSSQDWRKDAGQFIPLPQTWLNRTPWETEDGEMSSGSPKGDDDPGSNNGFKRAAFTREFAEAAGHPWPAAEPEVSS